MATVRGARILASLGSHSLKCHRLHQRRIISLGLTSLCQVSVKKRALLDTCPVPVNKYDLSGVGILSPTLSALFSTEALAQSDSSEVESEEDSEAGRVSKWPSPTDHINRQDTYSIFIGGYDFIHDVKYLKDLFSQFGEVGAVKIPLKDKYDEMAAKPGQYRYGFIEFTHPSSLKNAISKGMIVAENGKMVDIKARSVASRRSENKRTYMVNVLPHNITVQEVYDYFQTFGDVKLVNLVLQSYSADNQMKKRNYAFVVYKEGSDVQSLPQIEHYIGNTRIAVDRVGVSTRQQSKDRCKMVLLENLTDNITEEKIKSYFNTIGVVSNTNIFVNERGSRTGFGVVHFEDKKDALLATGEHFHDIDGVPVKVHLLGLLND